VAFILELIIFFMYVIKCAVCNFKFYNDDEELIAPVEILRRYSFRCPSCLKKLNFDSRNIKISVANLNKSERKSRSLTSDFISKTIKRKEL
jgi:hypothetical protein